MGTHTFAELEVSEATHTEIASRLREAGYDHVFVDGAIDMHGIGLTPLVGGTMLKLSAPAFDDLAGLLKRHGLDRYLRDGNVVFHNVEIRRREEAHPAPGADISQRALRQCEAIVDPDLPGTSRRSDPGPCTEYARSVMYGRVPYRKFNGTTLFAYVAVDERELVEFLRADAEAHLPPGTRFEIRRKPAVWDGGNVYLRLPFEQIGLSGMAWYRCEDRDSPNFTDNPDPEREMDGIVGVFVTSAPEPGADLNPIEG